MNNDLLGRFAFTLLACFVLRFPGQDTLYWRSIAAPRPRRLVEAVRRPQLLMVRTMLLLESIVPSALQNQGLVFSAWLGAMQADWRRLAGTLTYGRRHCTDFLSCRRLSMFGIGKGQLFRFHQL